MSSTSELTKCSTTWKTVQEWNIWHAYCSIGKNANFLELYACKFFCFGLTINILKYVYFNSKNNTFDILHPVVLGFKMQYWIIKNWKNETSVKPFVVHFHGNIDNKYVHTVKSVQEFKSMSLLASIDTIILGLSIIKQCPR